MSILLSLSLLLLPLLLLRYSHRAPCTVRASHFCGTVEHLKMIWHSATPNPPTNIMPTNIAFDSNFPGNPLWTWKYHPLELRLCLSQTLHVSWRTGRMLVFLVRAHPCKIRVRARGSLRETPRSFERLYFSRFRASRRQSGCCVLVYYSILCILWYVELT